MIIIGINLGGLIMKKLAFFLIPIMVVASCAKELNTNDPVLEGEKVLVKATIDNTETKTDYTISGSTATFCWSGTEEIGRLTWSTTMGQTVYTSTTAASSGETELTFSGNEVTDDTGFAVYPKKGASNGAGFDWYSADGYLYLAEAITYNPSAPLMNIVPMLGKLDADGKYVFKPVTGVVGVRILHVPANATKITISTNDGSKISQGLRYSASASFPDELDAVYAGGLQMTAARSDAKSTKTYNVSSLDFDTEYTFYYPLPAGTITGGVTVTVYNGTTALFSKSSTANLTVKRGTITRLPLITLPNETWTSLGTGKFIDTFVWSENSFGTTPVEVEFFKSSIAGRYRMANPYAAAANLNGLTPSGADDYFVFNLGEKGRVTYEWVNMGLPLSKNTAKTWAMIDGYSVAGYTNGYARSHVVSYDASGNIANLQLAPCYRTSDENKTGAPTTFDNEVGKDNADGIVEIAFPGNDILMPYALSSVTLSSNQSGDGGGAAALIDNNLTTFWHSPYSPASTTFDPVYGEYVQVKLEEGLSRFAFSYCTRDHSNQTVAPGTVVVGGSKNGRDWTVIGTFELATMNSTSANTWIGLPAVDASAYAYVRMGIAKTLAGTDLRNITSGSQYTNLSEFKVYGITTGAAAPWEPVLETGQVWVKASQITVNSDVANYAGTWRAEGAGPAGLVDFDTQTYWHSTYYTGYSGYYDNQVDYDPEYGITIDIALEDPIKDFHLSYYTRHNNNNCEPREIKFAGSNDGSTWTLITTVADDALMKVAAGARVDLPNVNATTNYSYLRIGITKAGNGDTPNSLTAGGNSTALAEILLFKD